MSGHEAPWGECESCGWETDDLIDPMPGDFRFVVVEKSPPYLVNVIELDAEFAQIGRSQVERALVKYAECVERYGDGPWPGYGNPDEPDEPNLVGPPGWLSYSEGMEL